VIWSRFSKDDWGRLIVAAWPKSIGYFDEKIDVMMANVIEIVGGTRKMLADYHQVNKKDQEIFIKFKNEELDKKITLEMMERLVKNVAKVSIVDKLDERLAVGTFQCVDIGMEVDRGLIDKENELVQAEIDNIGKYIESLKKKLDNVGFISRAPEAVVEKEKKKLADAEMKLADLQGRVKN
jgi:valyl-tRNA synthetase